ncbi:MAG: CARDB domain-containing protein [Planctomycetota bacterium]
MKNRSWLAWAVLCAAAVLGGKWMQADDSLPPEASEPAQVAPAAPPPVSIPEDDPQEGTKLSVPPPPARLPADLEEEELRAPAPTTNVRTTSFMPDENEESIESSPESADLLNKQSEQSVTLEWVGPVQIKVGQPFIYELVARNIGSVVAHDVLVRDKFHAGMKVTAVDPKGIPEADGILWKLGDIEPRQERRIRLEMIADKKGEVVCNATVTATTVASARFRVSEPQLVIKQTSPETAMIGDPVSVTIAISNPGDGPADNITIRSTLAEGLKHDKGSEFTYELGSLSAGETRTVNIVCTAIKGGKQAVTTVATSGTLEAQADSATQITEPKIDVVISGPRLRYLDRTATYTVAVSNPGDAIANNVKVTATTPPGFKFGGASNGGRHDYATRTIDWFIGTLAPGETKEVSYKCLAIQTGQHNHVVVASGQRGLKAESTVETTVEGIAAILLEVVDIDDPVEVGADTAYEIRVTNQGSREATNVEIHALVPREMQVRGGQGPTNYRTDGQEVIFAPLPKLAPRADAIYRVFVRGVGVGDVRFRARLISDSLSEPVIEEESTKIYDD